MNRIIIRDKWGNFFPCSSLVKRDDRKNFFIKAREKRDKKRKDRIKKEKKKNERKILTFKQMEN